MKPKLNQLITGGLAIVSLLIITVPGQAQEEQLQMAIEMQGNRVAGLNSLAEKIEKFQKFGFLQKSQGVVNKLDERERKQDPFGMAMDPEDDLPEIEIEDMDEGLEEAPTTSLQEALSKFSVTGIFPKEQQVMVGAQNLGIGDKVVIDYKGVSFNLEIATISAKEIAMKDLDTGETASVHLGFDDSLPAGMSRRRPEVTAEDKERQSQTIVPIAAQGAIKVD